MQQGIRLRQSQATQLYDAFPGQGDAVQTVMSYLEFEVDDITAEPADLRDGIRLVYYASLTPEERKTQALIGKSQRDANANPFTINDQFIRKAKAVEDEIKASCFPIMNIVSLCANACVRPRFYWGRGHFTSPIGSFRGGNFGGSNDGSQGVICIAMSVLVAILSSCLCSTFCVVRLFGSEESPTKKILKVILAVLTAGASGYYLFKDLFAKVNKEMNIALINTTALNEVETKAFSGLLLVAMGLFIFGSLVWLCTCLQCSAERSPEAMEEGLLAAEVPAIFLHSKDALNLYRHANKQVRAIAAELAKTALPQVIKQNEVQQDIFRAYLDLLNGQKTLVTKPLPVLTVSPPRYGCGGG